MKSFSFDRARSRRQATTRRQRQKAKYRQSLERLEHRSMLSVNLPPVNTVPSAQTATVDQPFAFTAYRGNLISISDPDAGGNQVQVTLSEG